MVKVFLHLSKDEQRARLQARIDDPTKNWKFRPRRPRHPGALGRVPGALRGRDHRDLHDWAPWYVVPADHKWVRDVAVASVLVDVLRELDPQIPATGGGLGGPGVE